MANFELSDAQAWGEPTKLPLASLDAALANQITSHVLSKLRVRFEEVDDWTDSASTPTFVKSIMAMLYVSWFYSRQFSEDEGGSNEYALRLAEVAKHLIEGLISGSILLEDDTPGGDGEPILANTGPSFYPTDASSQLEPTPEDPSLGPAKFSMGQVW